MERDQLVPEGAENSRVMMQVQAQVLMAKKFKRDRDASRNDIIELCKNKKLAQIATYTYERGSKTVDGPAIGLAKAMAVAWGNLDYNWYEMDRRRSIGNDPGESHVVVYCWDLQSNTRAGRTFIVRHWRDTQGGGYKLTDERDIYEVCANMAARRLRECILDMIPADIREDAMNQVKITLTGDQSVPLESRIKGLVQKFSDIGVTREMLVKRLGKNCETMLMPDVIKYQGIYLTLKDKEQSIESVFPSDFGNSNGQKGGKRPLPTRHDMKPSGEQSSTETEPSEAEKADQEESVDGIDWSVPKTEEELYLLYYAVYKTYPDKEGELKEFLSHDPIKDRPEEFYQDFIDGLKRIARV